MVMSLFTVRADYSNGLSEAADVRDIGKSMAVLVGRRKKKRYHPLREMQV